MAIPARIRQRLGWRTRQGGPSGGHHLVRASEAISFADILRSIDGPPALAPCASLSAIRQCRGRKSLETCTIRPVLLAVRDASTLLLEGMPLAPAGIPRGVTRTYHVTAIDGAALRPCAASHLGGMGRYILYPAWRPTPPVTAHRTRVVVRQGLEGGFSDAFGGGWGPVVATGLFGSGGSLRGMVGAVNTVECFLTFPVSLAFVLALVTGHWEEADGLAQYAWAVAGPILGGLLAAPPAGDVTRILSQHVLMVLVDTLVSAPTIYQTVRLL